MTNTLAVVFPGQGSQSVGMLRGIAAKYPSVQETFAEASQVLGYDLWQLVQQGPVEQLNQTVYTQPALLTASYAIWKVLQTTSSIEPAMLAGHSLGEYSALVCAGALKFSDAVKLVAARGQYMQEAVSAEEGAMAAIIGLDDASIISICEKAAHSADEVISPANYNSIGQVVVAGHLAPVERAIILAKEQGAKLAMLIPVSVPSHCVLMRPAADRLQVQLADVALQMPTIPVVSNVEARPYENAAAIRAGLIKQLYSPVLWVSIVQYFIQSGIKTVIECGPGKVLTGLNKRIDTHLDLLTTADTLGV